MARPPRSRRTRVILDVRTGSMLPINDARINLHEFGSRTPLTVARADGKYVIELPADIDSPSLFISRPDQPVPMIYTLRLDDAGRLTSPDESLLQIMNRDDGQWVNAEVLAVLPRIADATQSTTPTAALPGTQGAGSWAIPKASVPCFDLAAFQACQSIALKFSRTSEVDPQVRIFQVDRLSKTRLIAVAYPKGWTKFENLILFYHHTIDQNRKDYKAMGGEFPFGKAYMQFGFWHYIGGKRSLAYQLAASGRQAAVVLPMPDMGGVGEFDSKPAVIEDVLKEVVGHFKRTERGDFTEPVLGRTAVGSYSSGVKHTVKLFGTGGQFLNKVNEVYDIDGSFSSYRDLLSRSSFVGHGRLVRRYDQSWPGLTSACSQARLNPAFFCLNACRWVNHTEFPLPGKTPEDIIGLMAKPGTGPKLRKSLGGWVHAYMPSYAFHHALTISGFPQS